MQFRSDNAAPCPPKVMAALVSANDGAMAGYGHDDLSCTVQEQIRRDFDAPDARVFLVPSGTAANSLALANLTKPYATIYAHATAHINTEEGGGPEFFTGGAKICGLAGDLPKMTPDALRQAITMTGNNFPHEMPRGTVSLTNLTELGHRYSAAETKAIAQVARDFALPVHLDGARFANAAAASNAALADLTWRAGVDTAVFGATKLGAMGVEAVILFDPERADDFAIRMKRGGHLLSKSRYMAAQMLALLEDGYWRDLARHANAMAAKLAEGLAGKAQVGLEATPDGNILFATWPRGLHQALFAQGAEYYLEPFWQVLEGDKDAPLRARLVTSWATTEDEVAAFLGHF